MWFLKKEGRLKQCGDTIGGAELHKRKLHGYYVHTTKTIRLAYINYPNQLARLQKVRGRLLAAVPVGFVRAVNVGGQQPVAHSRTQGFPRVSIRLMTQASGFRSGCQSTPPQNFPKPTDDKQGSGSGSGSSGALMYTEGNLH